MPGTRLYIDDDCAPGLSVELDTDRTRYLTRVLRLHRGDQLTVFNGSGSEFHATLESTSRNAATLLIGDAIPVATESPLRAHLVQAVSRGERMDFAVQKATELGVKRITPVLTEYGVVKLNDERAARRRDHWRKVAIGACEQSGRVQLPLIDMPVRLKDWFGNPPPRVDAQVILKPGADRLLADLPEPPTKICLLIGPEGGFSDTEYQDADAAGFEPVSIGPRILRTETAAAATLAILQSRWGDLGASGV